ncbi:MAG: hypothetical protein K0S23_1369 [Fluviicola sp.]|jgi:hypothetical protein|uniref:hypothetical protein n=1 Tax=Fluviicola sp. TaxID=1917219 RepID=UPI00262F9A13|nr:hypothetical protein [Fluviicola sp.]MDF3027062.1 hypothetical protein [Fluviicola sp.]
MSGINFLSRFTLIFLIAGAVTSCGLKYVPGPSLEDLAQSRKASLEAQLGRDFAAVNKKYIPLTYGETVVVKPQSYERLDSLFEVKYRLSQNGFPTKEIDPLIEDQKMALLADTTEVLYMETHWFELVQDTTCEFIVAQCFLNNRNVLRKMDFIDEFKTGISNQFWAEKYMKEEWLTRDLGYTSNDDLSFYTMMKNKEFSLQGEEKTLFLENLFVVMRIASENRSTAAQGIVLKLAARQMKNEIPGFQVADYVFSFKKELDPETKQSIYVVEAASNKDKNVVVTRRYDSFFMPLN